MDILLSLVAEFASCVIFLGLAGLAVYWALVRNWKPLRAVCMGALMVLLYVGCAVGADQMSSHPDSWATLEQTFNQVWQAKSQSLVSEKMTPADISMIHGIFQQYFLYCLPAWIIVGALLAGLLAYYLLSSIGSRFLPQIHLPVPFWYWVIPEPIIFGLILGGIVKLFAPADSWIEMMGDNLLVLFLAIYTFAGLTITSFYFKKWRFSMIARLLSYILIFELTFNAICVLGVMDIWMDFRKLKKTPTEPAP